MAEPRFFGGDHVEKCWAVESVLVFETAGATEEPPKPLHPISRNAIVQPIAIVEDMRRTDDRIRPPLENALAERRGRLRVRGLSGKVTAR